MITREEKDFKAIISILYSTVRRGASVKTDPSANHKLKWTLRSIAPILIPDTDGPETDRLKEEALRAGIKKIKDFGYGTGYPMVDGNKPVPKNSFLSEFNEFLKINGVT
jgi:hypothetical protein